ncbi:uncharacterized protein LOC141533745 [Cotesia typhae]|uniref:uncharacterized protein LOC141533745 n=1 Tax=Cotesia typhae TaxID=2053667 RepID=UPI003D68DCA2
MLMIRGINILSRLSLKQLKTISESLPTNRKDIVDFNGVANFLEGVVQKEFKKMRQSLELSMTDKFKQLLKTIQYSAELPVKQKAWQDLGNTLPFDSLVNFLAFEESLTKDKQKKNSLIDVFQMITAGSTNCENDINQIMGKLIKKNVQLLYSGCGKKIKGVGKKSFKDTESFKIMEEFLRAKYHASQGKLEIISWVSRFLSGAKDREGGRAHRENKNIQVTE